MTPVALTLFPPPPAKPLNRDQQHVLDALTLGAATAEQIQTRLAREGIHRPINSIGSRLNELRKRGLIVKTGRRVVGVSRRAQDEWRLA